MADAKPLVSIILPIFNGASYLGNAIQSVLAQSFTDWELILVDDGSNDDSYRIARTFAEARPSQIRLLTHPDRGNRGTAATRNLGIAKARGDYVANLDQDDLWSATKLAEQVGILDSRPGVAMTFGPMTLWAHRDNPFYGAGTRIQKFTFEPDVVFPPPRFVPHLLSGRNDPHGYLARRKAITSVGGYVESVGICEDWALYTKIALSNGIFVSRKSNYYYRQHAGQTCSLHSKANSFYAGFLPFYNWLGTYLATTGCSDPEVLRAYRRAVWRNRVDRSKEKAKSVIGRILAKSRP